MDSSVPNTQSSAPSQTPEHFPTGPFIDRRDEYAQRSQPGFERRQFANSHSGLSPDAQELGRAIDQYKLQNRRRFITYEEMLFVIKSLGYSKTGAQ